MRIVQPFSLRNLSSTAALLGALFLVTACGDSGVDLAESPVCGEGMPGDIAVVAPTNGGPDRLAVVCWLDTTHTDPGWVALYHLADDGTFEEIASHGVGRQPTNLMVGDFDGDRIADILVDNTGGLAEDHYLAVLRGQSDGTFAEAQRLPSIGETFILNDVTGDGRHEIVVPLHNAAHAIEDIDERRLRRSRLPGVETTDRNGAVVPGLGGHERHGVVVDRTAGIAHLFPDGGSGSREVQLPDGAAPIHSVLAVADLNSDDALDLIVAVQGDDPLQRRLHLLISEQGGAWSLSEPIEGLASTPAQVALAPGDGGGMIHAFVSPWADPDGEDKFLFRFSIDTEGEIVNRDSITIQHFPYSMALGDFAGNGWPELVVRDMDGQRVTWFSVGEPGNS